MRVHNFSAGPGVLPMEVLQEAARDLIDHPDFGMSVMESSHRAGVWVERQRKVTDDLRRLLSIPQEFEILWVQGGASTQFAMVPLNLLPSDGSASADYIMTGQWSDKALYETHQVGRTARIAASSKATNYDRIPGELDLDPGASFVHYTSNNTVRGTQFAALPQTGDLPLVCDASSDILSRPMDFARHDLVYAGAQKNMGPAGVTLVIVRKSLLDRVEDNVPTMMCYKTHAAKASAYNTPPVWSLYMVGLVLEWVERQGGVEAMAKMCQSKAGLIYDVIDEEPDFYKGAATTNSRSLMNVTFRLPTPELEAAFVAKADAEGLKNLKGHRSVGGCRASLYNALPMESAQVLAQFMRDFRQQNA